MCGLHSQTVCLQIHISKTLLKMEDDGHEGREWSINLWTTQPAIKEDKPGSWSGFGLPGQSRDN